MPLPKAYAYSNPATVPLLTVADFAALAKSEITNPLAGTVLNNGDMGLDSPATCTGFPSPCTGVTTNGTLNGGVIQYQNAVALQGQTDATAAVLNIGGRTSDETLTTAIGGQTLTQGVYTVGHDATANITGDLTLSGDANSVFIFHLTSDLVTATGSRVLLTGGAQACNVFWKVDSSATLNGTTQMVGTVLAQASITFPGGGATLAGRAIAQTAAITFNNTTVNNSSCASPTPTPTSSPSSSSNSSSGSTSAPVCPTIASTIVAPSIIESRRVSPTSIFLSWGPSSGVNTFIVTYGLEDGKWLYSTNVSGFSTTINDLPPNQPIWFRIGARNDCTVGIYGSSKLIGGGQIGGVNPNVLGVSFPNTGFAPNPLQPVSTRSIRGGRDASENNIPWYILTSIGVGILALLFLIQRNTRFLGRH
ncbi:MAG: ice-binding family protein [Candidatus Daviesbacteria bacterium]|nr:ice-binding family protein [Candidatus Daviesbacteria bacterium]